MTKLTKEELLKLKRQYQNELNRQALEKEVEQMRKKAHPGIFDRVGKLIEDTEKTLREGLSETDLSKDAKRRGVRK